MILTYVDFCLSHMYVCLCICTYVGLEITKITSSFTETVNTTTLTIMWIPATNPYCEVLSYNITLYSNRYSSARNEYGLSTSTVFTDVQINVYNITVIAFNEAGNLSDSELNVDVSMNFDTSTGLLFRMIYINM